MINKLRDEFNEIYFSTISTTKGLEEVAGNIGISKNSLRRFLGKLNDGTKLRASTLNFIAQHLGYKNYQDFCTSSGKNKVSLDFELLDIYYGIVKGHGTQHNETRFQLANYYFAEKIISDPENLKEFMKRFADNQEALEYVLAWHPSYERISQESYQQALLKFAKSSPKPGIKVFVYSFILFGKFMSENLTLQEAENRLRLIRKYVHIMRETSQEFDAFLEARYTVAKCICLFLKGKTTQDRKPDAELQRLISMQTFGEQSLEKKIIYKTYVTNILNILRDYENADLCYGEPLPCKTLFDFCDQYPQYSAHALLYRLNWCITQFHLGKQQIALKVFQNLPSDINDMRTFSFDSKIYFEIKYLFFARKLFPKRKTMQKRFDILVKRTKFTYLKRIDEMQLS